MYYFAMPKNLLVIRVLVEGAIGMLFIAAIPTVIAMMLRNLDYRPVHALVNLAGVLILAAFGYYLVRDAERIYSRQIKKKPKVFGRVGPQQPYGE
jgi:hypothetical protein